MAVSSVTFGIVAPSFGSGLGMKVTQLVQSLGRRLGVEVKRRDASSYEALASDVRSGDTDIAWLPPIVFVTLDDRVEPIGSILRDGNATYEAALVVRANSRIRSLDGLKGTRAGWVDRWSASGYVLPRMSLSLLGTDPRKLFRSETFHGSHRSAIRALAAGLCDVIGTYARADDGGQITKGAWSEIHGANVRVIETFGAIPPDVLVIRKEIASELGSRTLEAFRGLCTDEKPLVREVFGGDELRDGLAPGYESLKAALEMATARGIFKDH